MVARTTTVVITADLIFSVDGIFVSRLVGTVKGAGVNVNCVACTCIALSPYIRRLSLVFEAYLPALRGAYAEVLFHVGNDGSGGVLDG